MKTILIMRHAKSDWNTPNSDFERPLNNRGLKAAPKMAQMLNKLKVKPELIVSSPAKRAITTAELVKNELNFTEEIKLYPDFYYGDTTHMLDTIYSLNNKMHTVLMVGHNPTVETLVSKLSSEFIQMPTATIVCIQCNEESWEEIKPYENKILWIKRPKEL